jgi:hypothetical protein
MRRREKFVISTIVLSLAFFAVQYVNIEWRYWAIGVFTIVAYLVSTWALSDDLQFHERLTIVPLPAMYAGAISLFYFLLPSNIFSQLLILIFFGIGMYALLLTGNIYSVAKGRTIQLLYAAYTVGLFLTLLTSLLFTNTIFSFRLPFWSNGLLVALVHLPLVFMSLWSVNLEDFIAKDILIYSLLITVFLFEFVMLISLIPIPTWNASLFVTGLIYLILGILHSFLRGRLFKNTITEYSLVAITLAILFITFFPWR